MWPPVAAVAAGVGVLLRVLTGLCLQPQPHAVECGTVGGRVVWRRGEADPSVETVPVAAGAVAPTCFVHIHGEGGGTESVKKALVRNQGHAWEPSAVLAIRAHVLCAPI